jgi:hypothetical protein
MEKNFSSSSLLQVNFLLLLLAKEWEEGRIRRRRRRDFVKNKTGRN